MRARRTKRWQLCAERRAIRSGWLGVCGVLLGAVLFGGLVFIAAPCLTPQRVAAQVLRGERIGSLTIAGETNQPVSTKAGLDSVDPGAKPVGLPLAPAVTNTTTRSVTIGGEKYSLVSFGRLAGFVFRFSDDILAMETDQTIATSKVLTQIPLDLRQLNERAVAVTGFMLPVKFNDGLVTDFMLLPNTLACCYGRTPRINEIVIVNTTGKGFKHWKDIPITIAGTFRVGAIRNDDRLIGIYQMDCEQIVETATLQSP